MKDTAENAAQKIQAKAESVGFKSTSGEVTIRRKVNSFCLNLNIGN